MIECRGRRLDGPLQNDGHGTGGTPRASSPTIQNTIHKVKTVPGRSNEHRPAVHELAVCPTDSKNRWYQTCNDTERVREAANIDAVCTNWLSVPTDSKNRRLPPAVHAIKKRGKEK